MQALLFIVGLISMSFGYPSGNVPGPAANQGANPAYDMFRNMVASFPAYANPLNYIPAQAYGPYGPPPGFKGSWGMGYSGPYYGQGYGAPNPAYGGLGLDTRFAGGAPSAGPDSTVVKTTDDGVGVSVAVDGATDGRPVFRSKTVQGPNSYGTAFAYSSG